MVECQASSMHSIPSRRIASMAMTALLCATIIRLMLEISHMPWSYLHYYYFEELMYTETAPVEDQHINILSSKTQPLDSEVVKLLTHCSQRPHPLTNHIRLNRQILNISMTPPSDHKRNEASYFNPAVIPLPSYAKSPYLLVSRLVTEGLHQESHICFADLYTEADARECPFVGMYCTSQAVKVQIPPTPAKKCTGRWSTFVDIPGFHDPRIFWSGRGEPLIEVNSGSQYGCIGLWMQDLRAVFPPLKDSLARNQEDQEDDWNVLGAVMGYRHLTELTRSSRHEIEKNWVLFFPREDQAWLQYDIMGQVRNDNQELKLEASSEVEIGTVAGKTKQRTSNSTISGKLGHLSKDGNKIEGGRSIAQLSSHGFTTELSLLENPCFDVSSHKHNYDSLGRRGHWHQGTNSLRLIMCTRMQMRRKQCHDQLTDHDLRNNSHHAYEDYLTIHGKVLHFSFIHRKFTGDFAPLRYERYLLLWEARKPFQMLGVSRYPILFTKERARPWNQTGQSQDEVGQYFTYTPSIAWTWRNTEGEQIHKERGHEDLGTGYIDDEVVIGIGIDDLDQGVVKMPVKDLLECIKICT